MSIIEREIEKRQLLIDEKATLMDQLKRLQDAVQDTQARIAEIQEDVLQAEIAELKSYLPAATEECNMEESLEEE